MDALAFGIFFKAEWVSPVVRKVLQTSLDEAHADLAIGEPAHEGTQEFLRLIYQTLRQVNLIARNKRQKLKQNSHIQEISWDSLRYQLGYQVDNNLLDFISFAVLAFFFKPDYPFKAKVTLGSPITRFKSDSVTPSDGTNTIDFYILFLFALLDSAPESHRVLVLHQVPQESVSFLAHVVQINVRHRVAWVLVFMNSRTWGTST